MLRLCEEELVSAPVVGGAPSVGSETPDDLNSETPALRFEPTLGSNPTVSNVHIVLYSLFNTFRRLSGGTPLSPPQPLCDWLPYGFASLVDVYAQGLQKMQMPPPLTSEFWGWRATLLSLSMTSWMMRLNATALASATSWHLATLCPGSALWRTLWDSSPW